MRDAISRILISDLCSVHKVRFRPPLNSENLFFEEQHCFVRMKYGHLFEIGVSAQKFIG